MKLENHRVRILTSNGCYSIGMLSQLLNASFIDKSSWIIISDEVLDGTKRSRAWKIGGHNGGQIQVDSEQAILLLHILAAAITSIPHFKPDHQSVLRSTRWMRNVDQVLEFVAESSRSSMNIQSEIDDIFSKLSGVSMEVPGLRSSSFVNSLAGSEKSARLLLEPLMTAENRLLELRQRGWTTEFELTGVDANEFRNRLHHGSRPLNSGDTGAATIQSGICTLTMLEKEVLNWIDRTIHEIENASLPDLVHRSRIIGDCVDIATLVAMVCMRRIGILEDWSDKFGMLKEEQKTYFEEASTAVSALRRCRLAPTLVPRASEIAARAQRVLLEGSQFIKMHGNDLLWTHSQTLLQVLSMASTDRLAIENQLLRENNAVQQTYIANLLEQISQLREQINNIATCAKDPNSTKEEIAQNSSLCGHMDTPSLPSDAALALRSLVDDLASPSVDSTSVSSLDKHSSMEIDELIMTQLANLPSKSAPSLPSPSVHRHESLLFGSLNPGHPISIEHTIGSCVVSAPFSIETTSSIINHPIYQRLQARVHELQRRMSEMEKPTSGSVDDSTYDSFSRFNSELGSFTLNTEASELSTQLREAVGHAESLQFDVDTLKAELLKAHDKISSLTSETVKLDALRKLEEEEHSTLKWQLSSSQVYLMEVSVALQTQSQRVQTMERTMSQLGVENEAVRREAVAVIASWKSKVEALDAKLNERSKAHDQSQLIIERLSRDLTLAIKALGLQQRATLQLVTQNASSSASL